MKILLFFFLPIFFSSESKNLGVFGETFAIFEKDLLEQMLVKLRRMEVTGELEQEKAKIQNRVANEIFHPKSINDITHTQAIREYKFDPTITVTRDFSDHRGVVFAKKGERFNPLNKINMSKMLLFIDGDEQSHIKWVISKIKEFKNHYPEANKIILVKGSPLELQKQLNRDIYFDQYGILLKKLGIRHVPAIVFQKHGEKILTIIEDIINLEDEE